MDTTKTYTSVAMAIRDFFGMLPGETIMGFMEELKALNTADKAEFKVLLQRIGYKILD